MPASCATTASAPTSGTCCAICRASTRRRSTSCCAAARIDSSLAISARTSGPCPSPSPGYSVREQFTVPRDLRRERADLFHAPHYVLPPLTPCKSVVTIHDCIHLRFPQYLPNRLGYAYARSFLWMATHRSDRILTVSEASKRDILDYFRMPPDKIDVIYNGIDERFGQPPAEDDVNAGARALSARRAVRALRRQHQAAQEPRAPDCGVPHAPPEQRVRARQAGHHRRRDRKVRGAAPRGPPAQAAQARPLLRVRAATDARDPLSACGRVRVSVALRGIRPAAARSDGQRHAGDHVERVVAA